MACLQRLWVFAFETHHVHKFIHRHNIIFGDFFFLFKPFVFNGSVFHRSTGRRGNTALQKMINCSDDPFLLTQDDVVDDLTFTDFHIYIVQVFNKNMEFINISIIFIGG